HHRQHELPYEIGLVVVLGDLRARAFYAEFAEIDPQLVGGLPRLGEVFDGDDAAHADVDLSEVVPRDRGHAGMSGFPMPTATRDPARIPSRDSDRCGNKSGASLQHDAGDQSRGDWVTTEHAHCN